MEKNIEYTSLNGLESQTLNAFFPLFLSFNMKQFISMARNLRTFNPYSFNRRYTKTEIIPTLFCL